jgi:excisionase family DNA binding protein
MLDRSSILAGMSDPGEDSQEDHESGAYLTRRQAGEYAGVHYNTIRLWEQAGKVQTERRGSLVLVKKSDLDRIMDGRDERTRLLASLRKGDHLLVRLQAENAVLREELANFRREKAEMLRLLFEQRSGARAANAPGDVHQEVGN